MKRRRGNIEAIKTHFAASQKSVFLPTELMELLQKKRDLWSIPRSYGRHQFEELLQERVGLKPTILTSDKAKSIIRFLRGDPSSLELGASLFRDAYFSHFTAAFINGLLTLNTTNPPIYINREQSPKPRPIGLTQEAIDRAFANNPRRSGLKYATQYGESLVEYVVVSGKHSNNFGTYEVQHPVAGPIKTTNIERTLIDAVVRPHYVGEFSTIEAMFENAKQKIDIDRMLDTLKKLDYVYPYHQTIGFLLQRTKYDWKDCNKFRAIGVKFAFYFSHGLKHPHYDPDWKVFYPEVGHNQTGVSPRRKD
jgi:hypothetical protein